MEGELWAWLPDRWRYARTSAGGDEVVGEGGIVGERPSTLAQQQGHVNERYHVLEQVSKWTAAARWWRQARNDRLR